MIHGRSPSWRDRPVALRSTAPILAAEFVLIHGSGPHPDEYRLATDAAGLVERVSIVETDFATCRRMGGLHRLRCHNLHTAADRMRTSG